MGNCHLLRKYYKLNYWNTISVKSFSRISDYIDILFAHHLDARVEKFEKNLFRVELAKQHCFHAYTRTYSINNRVLTNFLWIFIVSFTGLFSPDTNYLWIYYFEWNYISKNVFVKFYFPLDYYLLIFYTVILVHIVIVFISVDFVSSFYSSYCPLNCCKYLRFLWNIVKF